MSFFRFWCVGLLAAAAALGQCESTVHFGPSAVGERAARTIFPVFPGGDGDKRNAYIDRAGKRVQGPASHSLEPVSATVGERSFWGFRDGAGQMKIAAAYRGALAFSEGLAAVKDTKGKWGFVDEAGQFRIAAEYQHAGSFGDGLAAVEPFGSCECSYINKEGKAAFPGKFRGCFGFNRGVAKVEVSEGLWGFIDKTGKVFASISGASGEHALFSDGLAPSEKSGGHGVGFVNASGDFVIAPRFAFVGPFSDGLAAVSENGPWGYADKSGKYAIDPKFCDPDDVLTSRFSEGLAFACDPATKKFGFIDKQGRFVIASRFDRCTDPFGGYCAFDGGLAWVATSEREGYIDTKGRWIWSVPVGKGRR